MTWARGDAAFVGAGALASGRNLRRSYAGAMPDWEPQWNTYLARANGAVHSFVLDMGAAAHAPIETHPLRVQVRVKLQRPRPDGLRDATELDAMGKVEDAIVQRFQEKLDALYVGRYVGAGYTTFVFYLPTLLGELRAHVTRLDLARAISDFGPYEPQWLSEDDPGWRFYSEFLYPDETSRESMLNRDQLRQRVEAGDRLEIPRLIDHFAYFTSSEAADAASRALEAAGFSVDPVAPPNVDANGPSREKWGVQFHRVEPLTHGRPDAFCAEIRSLLKPLDGEYDGWGGVVVRAEA